MIALVDDSTSGCSLRAAITSSFIAYLVDANAWNPEDKNVYPAFNYQQMIELHHTVSDLKFLFLPYMAMNDEVIAALKLHPEVVSTTI